MQVDLATEKLLRLLALERKRVKELTQKVQEGKQKASPRRLRTLISEMKSRLPEVEAMREQVADAEKRLEDFESVREALFKGQETHASLRAEIREAKEKLQQARAYGEEMQQKLAARDKSQTAAGGAAELRYLRTLARIRTLEKHAFALRHLLDHAEDLRETNARAEQRLEEAQSERVRQMKEATMLRASLEEAQAAAADREKLATRCEWAEGKLNDLQTRLTQLETQAAHYRELQTQYEEMSDLVKRLRSLGDL